MAQVLKEAFTTAYHLHQTAIAREVFFVLFEVSRDVLDTLCKHRYLCFDRSCVSSVSTVCFKNICFLFSCKMRHLHQNFK